MNIYRISRNEDIDYDTFDSAVVIAESEDAARHIHPRDTVEGEWWLDDDSYGPLSSWTSPANVIVTYLGIANDSVLPGVVCASFNPG